VPNFAKQYRYKPVRVAKRYTLQNGTRHKTVLYMLQKGNITKRYVLQNGTLQTLNRHKTVRCKTVRLQNGTMSLAVAYIWSDSPQKRF
jgi:hypothetical protein